MQLARCSSLTQFTGCIYAMEIGQKAMCTREPFYWIWNRENAKYDNVSILHGMERAIVMTVMLCISINNSLQNIHFVWTLHSLSLSFSLPSLSLFSAACSSLFDLCYVVHQQFVYPQHLYFVCACVVICSAFAGNLYASHLRRLVFVFVVSHSLNGGTVCESHTRNGLCTWVIRREIG